MTVFTIIHYHYVIYRDVAEIKVETYAFFSATTLDLERVSHIEYYFLSWTVTTIRLYSFRYGFVFFFLYRAFPQPKQQN